MDEQQSDVVNLLHLTDPHLFDDDNGTLLGVNTAQSLQAVINAVAQDDFRYQAILASGDLIQDHNLNGYRRFAEMLKPLDKPVYWVEGNHDCENMGEHLAEFPHFSADKQFLAGDFWQVVLLNSRMENIAGGCLAPSQLDYLESCLNRYPSRFTLIVLHHNLLPTQSAWLDQHSLSNTAQLAALLTHYPNVHAILHGHIHQEVDTQWFGRRVLCSPSTSIQFKPGCDNFTLDTLAPGWRTLSLLPNGDIETTVKRLNSDAFLPDQNAKGY